jgi:hypothetical protein
MKYYLFALLSPRIVLLHTPSPSAIIPYCCCFCLAFSGRSLCLASQQEVVIISSTSTKKRQQARTNNVKQAPAPVHYAHIS